MDALDVFAPLVESDREPDDFEGFFKAVFDDVEAEQHVEEDSDSDVEVVNEPPVISLDQAREEMRELMVFFESCIEMSQNQAHREHWLEQLAMLGKVEDQLTMYKEPSPEAQADITKS